MGEGNSTGKGLAIGSIVIAIARSHEYGINIVLLSASILIVVLIIGAIVGAIASLLLASKSGLSKAPKTPWLSALLNLIPLPLGLGYVYLGRPKRFVRALLTTGLAGGLALVGAYFWVVWQTTCFERGEQACSQTMLPWLPWFLVAVFGVGIVLLLGSAVFATYDAYRLAVAHSRASGHPNQANS